MAEGDVVNVRPFRLGQKAFDKAVVTQRFEELSNEVETPEPTAGIEVTSKSNLPTKAATSRINPDQ